MTVLKIHVSIPLYQSYILPISVGSLSRHVKSICKAMVQLSKILGIIVVVKHYGLLKKLTK